MKQIKASEKILPAFHDFYKSVKQNYLWYVLKGGRNSSKSTHVAIVLILRRMNTKSHAAVIRRWDKYNSKSTFEQLKWAIRYLEVEQYWHIKLSPIELIYKPTGTKIMFFGGDNPDSIKSIKMADYPITDMWYEEVAQERTEENVTTLTNSIVRAELTDGLDYKLFLSYNPPKRRTHWLNKKYETQFIPPNTYVHQSTYLDNPHLSTQTLEEIESAKEMNPKRYEWEYLGKPTGSGVVPFDNLVFRAITDDECKSFDNIRQGMDFGYSVDPSAFVRMHYDQKRSKLYIFGELYGVKISNTDMAQRIKDRNWHDANVICDGAEPRSVAELQSCAIRALSAKKGPGSVEHGEKWLDDLDEIIIDPERCPNVAREFESIDYAVDKDGNPLPRLQDKDDHSITAVRYGMESDMKSNTWGW